VLIAGWTNPYIQRGTTSLVWLLVNVALWLSELNVWRHSRTGATRAGRGNLWIPLVCLAPGFAVFFLAPTIVPSADIRPAGIAFAVGIAILVVGLVLRAWAMKTLGRYFTGVVVTRAEQSVITNGPFRIVRHPGYSGGLLEGIGAGIAWGNWVGLAACLLCSFAVAVSYRIRIEEDALLAAFPDAYTAYAATRKRLIPFLW
jgi:protein-S-isoprenylcysteine O-methyltransferase Ste14